MYDWGLVEVRGRDGEREYCEGREGGNGCGGAIRKRGEGDGGEWH